MGIFSRFGKSKGSTQGTADAKEPHKRVEQVIAELEERRKSALQELRDYKVTAKQMKQQMERHQTEAESWEKRAMAALQSGDETLAKDALRKKRTCLSEFAKVKKDHDEAAGYAIQLNRSRKTLESKLQILKLKKGTVATQLAAAQGTSPFGDGELFDALDSVAATIEDNALLAEAESELLAEGLDETETPSQPGAKSNLSSDDALAALKQKMASGKGSE